MAKIRAPINAPAVNSPRAPLTISSYARNDRFNSLNLLQARLRRRIDARLFERICVSMGERADSGREAAGSSGRKVHIKTYGCQMNVYDSERMASLLRPLGYRAVDDAGEADLVILNTCHIREKAAEKLYSDLGRLRETRQARIDAGGGAMTVAVAGCVAQAEGAEVAARADIVDIVVGPQAYHRLPEMIARAERGRGATLDTDFAVEEKFDALAKNREADGVCAYVTVQEGCDKFCTFCVVPYTRGAEVSRKAEAIIAETRSLAAQGVREVTLLGKNVNAWASPPPASGFGVAARADGLWGLGELCRAIAKIDGVARIRFMTSHPRDMDDGLIA